MGIVAGAILSLPSVIVTSARGGSERQRFVAVNRLESGHYSRKAVQFRRNRCPVVLSLGFEVTDVTRPLVAVRRIIEKGNEVVLDRDGGRIIKQVRGLQILTNLGFRAAGMDGPGKKVRVL